MQDFDAQRSSRLKRKPADERTFQIAGETFTLRKRVRPETFGYITTIAATDEIDDTITAIDSLIRMLIRKGDVERWDELRERDDDEAVELEDLKEIMNWALSVVMDRPLERSDSSSDSSQTTDATSPVASLSLAGPSTD